MKLFSVQYSSSKMSIFERHIRLERSNEFFISAGSKIVVASDVVSRGREDSQTFFLPREKPASEQQEFFLKTNCAAVSVDNGLTKIVQGTSKEALILLDYSNESFGSRTQYLPVAGLGGEQLIAGSVSRPRLIKLPVGQEICFHQILHYTVTEKIREQRTGFWAFLGSKEIFFAVEKHQPWSLYVMFDGEDLRFYNTDNRIF